QVAEVLAKLWGGQETLIVISSDLSHYHDYATAQRMDRATSDAILTLHPERLDYEDACGRIPVQGLLLEAKRLGLQGELIDLRNSGDTAGSKEQVVGYGAYAFTGA
ncbi:MAG: AmmeMemoRadiSam system protein B, partial [Candidatus Thiodiazotropha sp.]